MKNNGFGRVLLRRENEERLVRRFHSYRRDVSEG
jgi:hypothetical protein